MMKKQVEGTEPENEEVSILSWGGFKLGNDIHTLVMWCFQTIETIC